METKRVSYGPQGKSGGSVVAGISTQAAGVVSEEDRTGTTEAGAQQHVPAGSSARLSNRMEILTRLVAAEVSRAGISQFFKSNGEIDVQQGRPMDRINKLVDYILEN